MLTLTLFAALFLPQDAHAGDRFFPEPSGPMTLSLDATSDPLSYGTLMDQYAELTGQLVTLSANAKDLAGELVPLERSVMVPTADVQTTFECLLAIGHFVLVPIKRDGARLVEVRSLRTLDNATVKQTATFLEPDEVHLAEQHPAMLFTTVVAMPSTETRFLCNALRTMLIDANVQSILPAGESNAVVVTDTGPALARWVRLLENVEAASAASYRSGALQRKVLRLKNRAPEEIAALLNASFGVSPETPSEGGPSFLPDASSNSVLVAAPAHRLVEIERIVQALDVK